MTDYTGKKVIIRAYRAGVFFGTLAEHDKVNGVVELHDCRRIWYWEGAASLSQMANEGVKNPRACKFTQVVPSMQISGVIEVLPCSIEAAKCIEEVYVWER